MAIEAEQCCHTPKAIGVWGCDLPEADTNDVSDRFVVQLWMGGSV